MWLRPFVDPYGALAALLSGSGWGAAADLTSTRSRSSSRTIIRLLAGPVSVFALGVGTLAAFSSWADPRGAAASHLTGVRWPIFTFEGGIFATDHVHYSLGYGQVALLLAGAEWVAMGLIAILPIPPLDGGKLLFHLAPRTIGWQRARYRLDDENWGVLVLLVLSLPVIFSNPPLMSFVGHVLAPLMRAII